MNLSPLSLANSISFVRQVTGLVLARVLRMIDRENHFRKPIAIVDYKGMVGRVVQGGTTNGADALPASMLSK